MAFFGKIRLWCSARVQWHWCYYPHTLICWLISWMHTFVLVCWVGSIYYFKDSNNCVGEWVLQVLFILLLPDRKQSLFLELLVSCSAAIHYYFYYRPSVTTHKATALGKVEHRFVLVCNKKYGCKKTSRLFSLNKRPGAAEDVLQRPLSFIQRVSLHFPPNMQNIITLKVLNRTKRWS